jgi:hypothetical protein
MPSIHMHKTPEMSTLIEPLRMYNFINTTILYTLLTYNNLASYIHCTACF